MNIFKQVVAVIMIFLGWVFITSAVGWIMMKGWLFVASFATVGVILLYFGNKLNKPFVLASKVKKLEEKRKLAEERKQQFERINAEQTASGKHIDDDLRAKMLERELEKIQKQENDE